jgi:hypothetical protein
MIDTTGMIPQVFTPDTFDILAALFIITFIQWEFPRTIKIISEEYTEGLYPPGGRVLDIFVFLAGLFCFYLLYSGDTMESLLFFLSQTSLLVLIIPVTAVIPLMIAMGFFKRLFSKMEDIESITVFLVQTTLDLAHTLFFISLALIAVPLIFYFMFGTTLYMSYF